MYYANDANVGIRSHGGREEEEICQDGLFAYLPAIIREEGRKILT